MIRMTVVPIALNGVRYWLPLRKRRVQMPSGRLRRHIRPLGMTPGRVVLTHPHPLVMEVLCHAPRPRQAQHQHHHHLKEHLHKSLPWLPKSIPYYYTPNGFKSQGVHNLTPTLPLTNGREEKDLLPSLDKEGLREVEEYDIIFPIWRTLIMRKNKKNA